MISLFVLIPGLASAGFDMHKVLKKADVAGGLVVVVGLEDVAMLSEIADAGPYLVHGLDADADRVDKARAQLHEKGYRGRITVAAISDGGALPFVDSLVNLFVIRDAKIGLTKKEIDRILSPRGTVVTLKESDEWDGYRKPVPEDIDQWSHFLHGPDNNAVAHDRKIGPPRHLRWMADPLWMRYHHTLASMSAMVTSGGRIFCILDEGPVANIHVEPQWHLLARDAFSGVLLWKRPVGSWVWHMKKDRDGPVDLPRRLVATDEMVFVTLGRGGPVQILNARTGKTLRPLDPSENADDLIFHNGVLLLVKRSVEASRFTQRGKEGEGVDNDILAFDPTDGKLLWEVKRQPDSVQPQTLAAAGDRVFFQGLEELFCLSLKNGSVLWTAQRKTRPLVVNYYAPTLVVADDVVLSADQPELMAFSAETGKKLWEAPCRPTLGSPVDVLVINGVVWTGQRFTEGLDLHTGQVVARNPATELATIGHHHRCYRNKATDRFVIGGYRGMEFYDLEGDDHSRNNWVRGTCQYGVLPANGLMYVPPHSCGCYPEAQLYGFYALAGGQEQMHKPASPKSRFEKGPVYEEVINAKTGADNQAEDKSSWPTLRADVTRSGSTTASIPSSLKKNWKAEVGGRLSALTVGSGKVFVSSIDNHTVHALDADTGKPVWPVHGSILVLGDVAYFSAGRSTYLDGGISVYGLDPSTGEVLHETTLESVHPDYKRSIAKKETAADLARKPEQTGQNKREWKTVVAEDRSDSFSMDGGAISDVLVSDGRSLYIKQIRLTKDLKRRPEKGRHLFSTSSLLDGNESHRSHWMLGTFDMAGIPVSYSWLANRRNGFKGVGFSVPYGVLLAFDNENAWCVWRGYRDKFIVRGIKPLLFARPNSPLSDNKPDIRDFGPVSQAPEKSWSLEVDIHSRAMIRAGDTLVLAGLPEENILAVYRGERGGLLRTYSISDGSESSRRTLESPPVWDGMAATQGRLYMAAVDGSIVCFGS